MKKEIVFTYGNNVIGKVNMLWDFMSLITGRDREHGCLKLKSLLVNEENRLVATYLPSDGGYNQALLQSDGLLNAVIGRVLAAWNSGEVPEEVKEKEQL